MSLEDIHRIAFEKVYYALGFIDPQTTEAYLYKIRAQALCRFALGLGADPNWSEEQLEIAECIASEIVDEIDALIDMEDCDDR